jgi:hypothetical protein
MSRVIPWCKVWCFDCASWDTGDGNHRCPPITFDWDYQLTLPGTPEEVAALDQYVRTGQLPQGL